MIKKIHHIAIVVPDLVEAEKQYRSTLSLSFEKVLKMPEYKVEIGFISVGDVWLEFISPTEDEPRFTPFLKKNGPGLHHIAYVVKDIRATIKKVKASGVEPENDKPLKGADGLICFISPNKLAGVYTELVQAS